MATPVIMPRQGQTVESCVITQWHKQVGDSVSAGDVLFSYETDKAAFDEVSPADGILLARYFEENDDVPVLTTVCVIGQQGEDISSLSPGGAPVSAAEGASVSTAEGTPAAAPAGTPVPAPGTAAAPGSEGAPAPALGATDRTGSLADDSGRVRISPRAKSLAERARIDYRDAAPSGPAGRIIERDIAGLISERAATHPVTSPRQETPARPATGLLEGQARAAGVPQASPSPAGAFEEIKLSNMRKRIAEAMYRSLSTTAQLTLHSSFDASDILAYRKRLKDAKADDPVSSVNVTHMILYAVSKTLLNHRSLNAHLLDDRMLLWNHVNLGIAVDTDRGLMVPTLFEADRKSLIQIAMEAKQLADACRTGSIGPDYLQNGTFTVTNLGALGVEYFTPVLNPPQTAILGVGSIVQRIKGTEDGVEPYRPRSLADLRS